MTPSERTRWICERARAVGFDLCGVVEAEKLAEAPELRKSLPEWLARGYAGEMNYLRDSRRADPRLVLEGARSVVVVALTYNSEEPYSTECAGSDAVDGSPRGWISRYAWGDDYHEVIGDKLDTVLAAMHVQFPEPFQGRAYVDTGPIVEPWPRSMPASAGWRRTPASSTRSLGHGFFSA